MGANGGEKAGTRHNGDFVVASQWRGSHIERE